MKDSRLGDRMPNTRDPKWGAMKAGESHLSDEWHGMEPSSGHMSDRYESMTPSKGHMSDRWVEMESEGSNEEWNEMRQEKRIDPYAMAPSSGDRDEAAMVKQSKNPMKNSGHGRYEVSTSEGGRGKGL